MFYLLAVISLVLAAADLAGDPGEPARRAAASRRPEADRPGVPVAGPDRVFAGYALTVAFAYASLFGYIAGSSFVLQEVYGLSATQFSLVFALNAGGMVVLGLLNARLVRRFAVRRLLIIGCWPRRVAAVLLLVVVGTTPPRPAAVGTIAVLAPLFVVVATRGLVSANATVLALQRPQASGAASAVLGACMFAGGILVTPCWRSAAPTPRCRWRPSSPRCAGGAADHRAADPGSPRSSPEQTAEQAQSGMLPCAPRPAGAEASASATRRRVCAGVITSSTKPRATALSTPPASFS